ncbi:MAG: molybdenum cofactor guanylyltransferase [bacterium]
MVKIPNMLIIGSAGRNSGKTEFACRLIRRYRSRETVIGVKITTIDENGRPCPRGGEGCGVCNSFTGKYAITEERDGPPGKDTVRMLEAGAHKVFWLRVQKDYLREGVFALRQLVDDTACIICESNSSRLVLEPGFFLVMQKRASESIKLSCRNVIRHADKIVTFSGSEWDMEPGDLVFADGQWSYLESATAVVLAGGESRRMGTDKSLLSIAGKPMIQHIVDQLRHNFQHLLISANEPGKYDFMDVPVVFDQQKGMGPLMGILSSLQQSPTELNFITTCDAPDIRLPIVRKMLCEAEDHDAVIPLSVDGRYEPLFAVYRKSVIHHCQELIEAGERKIATLFDRVSIKVLNFDQPDWFQNINTPEEYTAYTRQYRLPGRP